VEIGKHVSRYDLASGFMPRSPGKHVIDEAVPGVVNAYEEQ
jgi:hypothetical protein